MFPDGVSRIQNRLVLWLRRRWHLLLLLAALLFFIIRRIPPQVLSIINADYLMMPAIFHDVIQEGHSLRDWHMGGGFGLFPDFCCFVFSSLLTGDCILAIMLCNAVLLILLIAGAAACYAVAQGKRLDVFVIFTVLFGTALIHYGIVVTCNAHYNTLIIILGAFLVTQYLRARETFRWGIACILLALLVFLGVFCDALMIVQFSLPVAVFFTLEMMVLRRNLRRNISLLGLVAAATILGAWLFRHCGLPVDAGDYTQFHPEEIPRKLHRIWDDINTRAGGFTTLLFYLDLLSIPAIPCVLMVEWVRKGSAAWRDRWFFIMACSWFSLVSSWGALVLTNNYLNVYCLRYCTLVLVIPPLLIFGVLCEVIPWGDRAPKFLAVTVASIAGLLAFFPPEPSDAWHTAQICAPSLRALMRREKIEAGLAEYWHANLITFLPTEPAVLRAITGEGRIYQWWNNEKWYTGFGRPPQAPSFRLILMDELKPDEIRAGFGDPDRIERIAGNHQVWIYRPEDAICYNPIFGELGNSRHFPKPAQFHVFAADLPRITGHVEDGAVVALEGVDHEGYVSYGPYLRLAPGRYRVDFIGAWLSAPARDKPAAFDCVIRNNDREIILSQGPVTAADMEAGSFSREITIPPTDSPGLLETRIFYRGSGNLRLDSLTITAMDRAE